MPGFKNIVTYIQSGNVVFDHASSDRNLLISKIEAKLQKVLGYEVKTILKTMPDIEAVISNCPFKDVSEDSGLHVTFLSSEPEHGAIELLIPFKSDKEQLSLVGTELYLKVKKGSYGNTKLSNALLEKKLKVSATTRNWATVNKMLAFG